MANMIQMAKEQITKLVNDAYLAAAAKGELPEGLTLNGSVEIPKDTANGDYAANFAMASAKLMRMPPRKVAETLIANMQLDGSWFASCEVAGPGFMNFRMGDKWYGDVVRLVNAEGDRYGNCDIGKGQKLMVEFVSANPTGPMHMGNARGGVLGDALASVLQRAGYDVWREFYVNDAGNQIEKFASSIEARCLQLVKGEDAVEFPEDGYHGDDIKELARLFCEKYGESWMDKPQAERHEMMAKFGLEHNLPKMKSDLERYGIKYDEWFYESSLH